MFIRSSIVLLLLVFSGWLYGADDRAELYKLQMENRRLRHEIDQLRQKLADQDRDVLKFRQWMAGVADAGKVQTVSDRELRLVSMLSELIKRSSRLVSETADIQRTFKALIKEMPMGPAQQARLLLQLEQLERVSIQLASIASVIENDPQAFQEIRVIAVNRELEIAVVSAGSVHGVFPGLIYHGKSNKSLRLRIISVRPWVSAAVPVGGNLDQVTPGMAFSAAQRSGSGSGLPPLRIR